MNVAVGMNCMKKPYLLMALKLTQSSRADSGLRVLSFCPYLIPTACVYFHCPVCRAQGLPSFHIVAVLRL